MKLVFKLENFLATTSLLGNFKQNCRLKSINKNYMMADYLENGISSESPEGDRSKLLTGEEIVISGISGLFPNSNSVSEFMDNLYNKVDMVTKDDLNFDHPEAPKYFGKISGIEKFDSQFFRVTHNQAVILEPLSKMLLEQGYTAIFDAGINPLIYKGTKIGVYIGNSFIDSANMSIYTVRSKNGFFITGNNKNMFSNRISYFLDGKAPSMTLDCSCAGGIVCLEQAYNDIKSGICEVALVGACELCLHPVLSLNMKKTGVLCLDGKTKCFDKKSDGFVRAEAVNLMFLQKAKDAKRIYAEISFIKSTFGLKPDADFLPIREKDDIVDFLESFYDKAGVSPAEVEYLEAHGTALPEADANELQAISDVFAKEKSIMVGCVKSNIGNSASVSGLCGITKLCLAYHKGKLPANLHYNEPLDISAIKDGRVKVLRDNVPFKRGYTALNNFAFTGTNCHVLLKGHYKPKDIKRYESKLPRLVFVSGRTEESVKKIFNILKSQPVDPELIGLLHNIYQVETPGHTTRGYAILDTNDKNMTVLSAQSVELYPGGKRPLCLVYSGMGSQWAGMGTELMRIPIFAAAIEKCRKALEPKGVDIVRIITDPDPSIFDNIINCFVGIAAVQIGLSDILREIGVDPDYLIGHSVGEMGCAYYDGCFTAEEMILSAYMRGLVSLETEFIKGSMAAIGLGYNDVLPIVPAEIEVACHNSSESCTISGPADKVKIFVAELKAKNIFAKEVASANIAYHSKYVAKAGPALKKRLNEVFIKPAMRSEKWICTSMPKERWDEPLAKIFSPDYLTNNLLSPVYFEESARLIPLNAVIIEVAPHGLLQAILKRSHRECIHLPLTRRGHSDPVRILFESFGLLYKEGFNLRPDVLYPRIQYPVSTETPIISHFVEWYHEQDWYAATYVPRMTIATPYRRFVMSLHDDDYNFIAGHTIEDTIMFPKAAILFLLWETLAMFKGLYYEKMSTTFNDVQFHVDVVIDPEETLKLEFNINKGNDYFEVTRNNILVANGYIAEVPNLKKNPIVENFLDFGDNTIDAEDIYKVFHTKGYHYREEFQSILSASHNWNAARLKWTGNWITFLDSLIQLNTLARDHDGVSTVQTMKNITINVVDHSYWLNDTDSLNGYIKAYRYEYIDLTRCGGVEIRNIIFKDQPLQRKEPDALQIISFIPYETSIQFDLKEALQINLQIVADNINEDVITISEQTSTFKTIISDIISSISENIWDVSFKVEPVKGNTLMSIENCHLLVVQNFTKNWMPYDVCNKIVNQTFILSFEHNNFGFESCHNFNVISSMMLGGQTLILLRKATCFKNIVFLPVTSDTQSSWLTSVQFELKQNKRVVLISGKELHYGIFGLVKKLKKEFPDKLSCMLVNDDTAQSWNPECEILKNQIKKNLVFNIFKKGQWGNYYSLPSKKITNVEQSFSLIDTEYGIGGLKWAESRTNESSNYIVQVCFAGPSIRDAQKAVGISGAKINGFGMDFSGLDKHGNRVMGVIGSGAISSSVEADLDLLWPVPDNWTLEEAATVPLPYVQAMYCLTFLSDVLPSQSVFVTGGTGALGQAVISLCMGIGCTVFTCVGDIHKKRFLMKLFPNLKENNIGYSNDGSFLTTVISNTKNKCCDIVISSMSGRMREVAMNCAGRNGIFIDLSINDMTNNKEFGLFFLSKIRSYIAGDVGNVFKTGNSVEKKILQRTISEGISKGYVKPISHLDFTCEEVSRAFRLLAFNKHRGRVLIKMNDSEPHLKKTVNVLPKMTFASSGLYIVVCDGTKLGIDIANRLIQCGANKISLHMNSNELSGYLQTKLVQWDDYGVNVTISTENIDTESSCVNFFKQAQTLEEVYGIFFIQGCTKANSQEDDKENNILSVANSLNNASRFNCYKLRYFVIVSRVTQNFEDECFASELQKICEQRAEIGLPSLMFRASLLEMDQLEISNTKIQPQPIEVALNALEISLKNQYKNVLTFNLNKNTSTGFTKKKMKILIQGTNIEDIDKALVLKDLISTDIGIEEIKHVLKEYSHHEFSAENINDMTVERLIKLGEVKRKHKKMFDSGLFAFYNYVNKDECAADDVLIPMTTLSSSIETEYNLDTNGNYLMLFPGFDGHHEIFKSICERLKIGAVAFQLRPNDFESSITETAIEIKKHMLQRFTLKSKFCLLGYSYGVNVALEVAALLEKDGMVGIVYCLDSSPDALRIQLNAYLGHLSESQMQNSILKHFFYIMGGQTSDQLNQEIENIEKWSDKIEVFVNHLKKLATYTTQYQRAVVDAAYKRIILAREYQPDLKLESELVLLKGIPHPNAQSLPSDYNLSKYTKKPVKLYELSSDLATVPEDSRVSNIINRLLDPELLNNFREQNLCETYLTNVSKTCSVLY